MTKYYYTVIFLIAINSFLFSQNKESQDLKEIVITSTRIDLPFSKNSKTITILSSEEIKAATATNLADLLQQEAGIEIVRRGINGMQSDLKIRGGNFEQTLILIDGIKTEDAQTGHHTMNMMIPLENIERIEIVKGAAARIFGQNAFTGAINIVTKKHPKNKITLGANSGSFGYKSGAVTAIKNFKKSSHQVHYSYNESEGYINNTDFRNSNYFLKSTFKTKKEAINVLATFADRKFGAQYFYTTPRTNFTEYEKTQTSLVAISTKLSVNNLVIKPKIYWKRNQDMFFLKRQEPSYSRNFNISNKIGAVVNTSFHSKIGITGLGIDFAKTTLASNNLGNQSRTTFNGFVEHRFLLADTKLDITPGVSLGYFSDFGLQVFPGLDLGYKATDKTRLYWNVGASYRVPTYTELYINIPNFLSGNENLKPETAVTQEIGVKYHKAQFSINSAVFYRVSKDLIDYVKATSTSPVYKAQNLRQITTTGFELSGKYGFKILNHKQQLKIGYTFLDDNYKNVHVYKSRYLINSSIKHHFTASLNTEFIKNIKQSISYKYVNRYIDSYDVVDVKISTEIRGFTIFGIANNIFNTSYFEKEYVPMPQRNFEIGVKYRLD